MSEINMDSLLEHIPAPNVKIDPVSGKLRLTLLRGSDDEVKDTSYDYEKQTLHLTLDFYDGISAGLAEMYSVYLPGDTRSIVVDAVLYHGDELKSKIPDIDDFTED